MRFLPVDPRVLTDTDLDSMHDVCRAAGGHDDPAQPVPHRDDLRTTLTKPWPGTRSACWLSYDDGRAIGFGWLSLPGGAHASLSRLQAAVCPDDRRRGAGRGLVREAVRLAYATGRTSILHRTAVESPGSAFAQTLGAEPVLREVHAVLAVGTLGRQATPDRYAVPPEYELIRLRGNAPPDLAVGIAAVHEGVVDAPLGDLAWTHQRYDADRLAAVDAMLSARDLVQLRVLALDRVREVVGITSVVISERAPARSDQGDTVVAPAHRGHGLGLAMKTDLLRWLAAEHPAVRELNTWVAEDNRAIRAVNRALGYREVGRGEEWRADVSRLAARLGLL